MRTIERTSAFKRDFKRESKGEHRAKLAAMLGKVIEALAMDESLPAANRDHALTGEWKDYRDCHVRPDLVLIYTEADREILQLVRLGSHAELFE